jgi:hypothetical protein
VKVSPCFKFDNEILEDTVLLVLVSLLVENEILEHTLLMVLVSLLG